jgi:hypothetical protein
VALFNEGEQHAQLPGKAKVKVWIALAAMALVVIAVTLALSQPWARSSNGQPLSPAEIARQEGYDILALDVGRQSPEVDACLTAMLKERFGTRWLTWTVQESQGPVKVYAYPPGDPVVRARIGPGCSGLPNGATPAVPAVPAPRP